MEEELRTLQESIRNLAKKYVAQGKCPDAIPDVIQTLDKLCDSWSAEVKHLHKRLVATLHALSRAKESQKKLQERVVQLDQMLVRTPDYDLRAQFAVITKERDLLKQRLIQVNRLLASGDGDATTRLVALARQNESLRGELRSARRLIRSLERHIQVLEREEAEKKGISVERLHNYDLPPGAFDSFGDTPTEDPVETDK